MRVTNETIEKVIKADLMQYDKDAQTLLIFVKDYAADLQDARAELEKSKAMIREMREALQQTSNWMVRQYAGANSECLFCGNTKDGEHEEGCFSALSVELLEKSKEYAK